MAWEPTQLRPLRQILAELYPTDRDQRRIVHDTGLNASRIAFDASADNSWHAILTEANKHGKVDGLLAVAMADYPDNELLRRAKEPMPPRVIQGPEIKDAPRTSIPLLEKIIGSRSSLVAVSYLELGLRRARSVAKVRLADGSMGSGFLIADNLLLTNHHVLPDAQSAATAIAVFNYEKSIEGTDKPVDELRLLPSTWFLTSVEDDWTIVAVEGNPNTRWGAIELGDQEITVGARVNIIQHPGGGPKHVSLNPGAIAFVDSRRLQYLTDTLPGSSGSPVFDEQWNLVGLHHSGGWLSEPGSKDAFYRNEGIRIGIIIAALAEARRTI
jgi:V8-like Glu-specific endopeptidase